MEEIAKTSGTPAAVRRAGAVVGLALLLAGLVLGTDLGGARERLFGSATPPPRPSAFSRVAGAPAGARAGGRKTVLRSQPWWQLLARRSGGGAATLSVRVDPGAIQWRVRATCRSGRLVVRTPGSPAPVLDTACPGPSSPGLGAGTGERRLDVTAAGPWKLVVEQQVDVPLEERPLPAMTAPAARRVLLGGLYRIDQAATGRATVYRLGSGGYALRLTDLYVTPNVDLELRLSPLAAPRSTREFTAVRSAFVARLDVTAGSLNFRIPAGVDPAAYRSLVVWCPPVHSAYAAATLRPAA